MTWAPSGTLLLVENDIAIAQTLRDALGYTVKFQIVRTVADALQRASVSDWDAALISDLPGMSGADLIRHMRVIDDRRGAKKSRLYGHFSPSTVGVGRAMLDAGASGIVAHIAHPSIVLACLDGAKSARPICAA